MNTDTNGIYILPRSYTDETKNSHVYSRDCTISIHTSDICRIMVETTVPLMILVRKDRLVSLEGEVAQVEVDSLVLKDHLDDLDQSMQAYSRYNTCSYFSLYMLILQEFLLL